LSKIAVIAGAGPAGLTAALEVLRRTECRPLVFETDNQVGGISKTVNYRGNRMDLGGHRFFSKSDWVMNWWQEILPVDGADTTESPLQLAYQGSHRRFVATSSDRPNDGRVMIVRSRLSRIYYRRRFFDYPLKLSPGTIGNLGLIETGLLATSYANARWRPRHPETTLEDFFVNRFGERLYRTFFKDYTEKVWGVPCREISSEWGAQRVKGLSITTALRHALRSAFRDSNELRQKAVETSLIERFLYPRLGPGQMWEEVAARVVAAGGEIHLRHRIINLRRRGPRIEAVEVLDLETGSSRWVACDHFVSTMPVRDLVAQLQPEDPRISDIASGLPYRDFMTAGLIVRRMKADGGASQSRTQETPRDNWIYIQEPDVKLGRLQIFNNWSPDLVADPDTVSLGLEYFCGEGDELWSMDDAGFLTFAAAELEKIGLIEQQEVLDGTVVRVPKAYPAYFGQYARMGEVRAFLDQYENLYAVGRNGMHRYNNQDHSMLAARAAVDCIAGHASGRESIWSVNTEDDYHEERSRSETEDGSARENSKDAA
jgi:protoporphyrinogen oxidase